LSQSLQPELCKLAHTNAPVRTLTAIGRRPQPQFGVSNQQISVEHAAHWAACLGRTLVVPPVLFPRANNPDAVWDAAAGAVGFDQLYAALAGGGGRVASPLCGGAPVRAEPLAEFLGRQLPPPSRVFSVHPDGMADRLSDRFFDEMLGWAGVPRGPRGLAEAGLYFCHDTASAREIRFAFARYPERVLAVNGMYRCRVASLRRMTEAFRNALFEPSPMLATVLEAALTLAAKAGGGGVGGGGGGQLDVGTECLCLQLRLGDFVDLCEAGYPWVARKVAAGLSCIPPAKAVRGNVTQWPGRCVTLLTNDPPAAAVMLGDAAEGKHMFDSDALAALSEAAARLGEDEAAPLRGRVGRPLLALMVEQHICAHSARVLLNGISTFGETLSMQRIALNRSYYWW
jgi:hypothetical protein